MPIYFIIIICFITSILVTAIEKYKKNKKMLITGKCLILLLSIGLILFAIYKVEKNQEKTRRIRTSRSELNITTTR